MKLITNDNIIEEVSMWNYPEMKPPNLVCLQGEFQAKYDDIVAVFGSETSDGDGYKVQAEWHIITPDGWATIYDYKQGKSYHGEEGISKHKVTEWHIGGESQKVVPWILSALNK